MGLLKETLPSGCGHSGFPCTVVGNRVLPGRTHSHLWSSRSNGTCPGPRGLAVCAQERLHFLGVLVLSLDTPATWGGSPPSLLTQGPLWESSPPVWQQRQQKVCTSITGTMFRSHCWGSPGVRSCSCTTACRARGWVQLSMGAAG